MGKDFSLLRPFDLEAAKRGEPFVFIENGELNPREYIAGPDCRGWICIKYPNGKFDICIPDQYRMAPLCWVEWKPVYKGDGPLYHHELDRAGYYEFIVEDFSDGKLCLKSVPAGYMVASPENLTWTPPKVKREGWVNIHGHVFDEELHCAFISHAFHSKELADKYASSNGNRIACVRIEWEE